MSSNQFHHGLSNRDHVDSQGFIRETPTNVIGLVAFADDADEQFYPLNTPVLITNINTGLAKSGYHGNLRKSLETIQAIVNPTIVVVRIPSPFVDGGFNASRVIGTTQADGKRTGLQALLTAKSRLGVVPKINIVPDCETPDVINALININKKLRAFSYATPRDAQAKMLATKEEVVAYRKTLGDKEVMLVWPEFTAGNVLQSDYASTLIDMQGTSLDGELKIYVNDDTEEYSYSYDFLYNHPYHSRYFNIDWNREKGNFILSIHSPVHKIRIESPNSTRPTHHYDVHNHEFEVNEFALEGEYIIHLYDSQTHEDTTTINITPTAKLTKQTGTHSISTSNGFTGTGTLDELSIALRDYLIDVNLDGQDMVFTNHNAQLVNISINAQGRSGKNYVAIEQENTSIQLDGKNVTFSLAQKAEVLDGFRFRLIASRGFILSKSAEAYTYSPHYVGTAAEHVLNLSNFLDDLSYDIHGKTKWSQVIDFNDVNHKSSEGYLTIRLSSDEIIGNTFNVSIDMNDVTNLEQFFDKVKAELGRHDSKIQIEYSRSAVNEPHIPAPDGINGGFVFEEEVS